MKFSKIWKIVFRLIPIDPTFTSRKEPVHSPGRHLTAQRSRRSTQVTAAQQPVCMKNTRTHEPCGIMITGGAGFIASHVALRLLERYPTYKIIILDSLEYCSNLKNIGRAIDEKLVTFVKGDIRSADLVNHLMVQHKIDTVLHFAAETHVDNSFGNSFAFTQTNVLGTHVLLESSVRNKIKRFLHVSTDEVYGESSFTTSRSNCETTSLLAPTNPYSASKAAAEMLVMAYGQSYGLPYVITRGNNVFGPHQYPEKAIPKFIFLLRSNKKIALHGDGSTLRSYMHVSDAASAFDVVLHYGKKWSSIQHWCQGRTYNKKRRRGCV